MKTRRIWSALLGIVGLLLAAGVYVFLVLRPPDPHRLALKWEARYAWLDVLGYAQSEQTGNDVWALGAVDNVVKDEVYKLTNEVIRMRRKGGVTIHYAEQVIRDVPERGWSEGDWVMMYSLVCEVGAREWQQCAVINWSIMGYVAVPDVLLAWEGRGT